MFTTPSAILSQFQRSFGKAQDKSLAILATSNVSISRPMFGEALEKISNSIHQPAALFDVIRHSLPQFFKLLRMLSGKRRHTCSRHSDPCGTASSQEQHRAGRKGTVD
jgi:hypothetical protein